MSSSSPETILVTGANGYLSLHLINKLLIEGYNVRGTVRSHKANAKVQATFPTYFGSRLTTVFIEDLTNPEHFRNAFDGNTVGAIHVASPVYGHVEDNVRDMLEPAAKGATGILEASRLYGGASFRRVVHTSSFAAMIDATKGPRVGYVYTESDWNPITFEEAAALGNHVALYIASKALSEKAVWAWMEEKKPNFDITCVNPSMVLGPHLEAIGSLEEVTSTAKLLWHIIDAAELPNLEFAGCIDVRDTAAMLVAAFQKPSAGGQRLLLAHHFDWQSVADAARELLPEETKKRIPVGRPGTGRSEALESLYQADGSKAVEVLGIEYRPLSETVVDTLKQFLAVDGRAT